ncbi:hypothetical protein DB43_AV00060 [Parachlamydia acanthamoebae]|uniref:Uncharacterized protein n=1 Tax=Parachlamydia acanthamoebae TaxID=83552 RepID=A0A0C1E3Q4_9BACT|nr:hypothetical protein DB43_AV00060 [Parachlamydia acanthamoebae]
MHVNAHRFCDKIPKLTSLLELFVIQIYRFSLININTFPVIYFPVIYLNDKHDNSFLKYSINDSIIANS